MILLPTDIPVKHGIGSLCGLRFRVGNKSDCVTAVTEATMLNKLKLTTMKTIYILAALWCIGLAFAPMFNPKVSGQHVQRIEADIDKWVITTNDLSAKRTIVLTNKGNLEITFGDWEPAIIAKRVETNWVNIGTFTETGGRFVPTHDVQEGRLTTNIVAIIWWNKQSKEFLLESHTGPSVGERRIARAEPPSIRFYVPSYPIFTNIMMTNYYRAEDLTMTNGVGTGW